LSSSGNAGGLFSASSGGFSGSGFSSGGFGSGFTSSGSSGSGYGSGSASGGAAQGSGSGYGLGTQPDDNMPQILLFSNGDLNSFVLTMWREGVRRSVTLQTAEDGTTLKVGDIVEAKQ
jgi:hypothetical protein